MPFRLTPSEIAEVLGAELPYVKDFVARFGRTICDHPGGLLEGVSSVVTEIADALPFLYTPDASEKAESHLAMAGFLAAKLRGLI